MPGQSAADFIIPRGCKYLRAGQVQPRVYASGVHTPVSYATLATLAELVEKPRAACVRPDDVEINDASLLSGAHWET